ncbi:MAG: ATP-binding cassette domain-containing protein [Acidimicrobiales bacterium]
MSSDLPVISARGLRKAFSVKGKVVEAVRGVDLAVQRGEIFGFLGPNGAGKTTTLRMLTTLLPIGRGEATVAGFDVARQPRQVRARTGYVSQLGGADELATGRENLVLQGRLYGGTKAEVAARADEVMEVLDLKGIADRRVKTYSGGQRRRLDVALGIVHRPDVLFLDEPSTGLDPQNRAHLWEYVRLLRSKGTTVFLTTHYLEEADALCERVMIMDHGLIVAEGSPRELKRQVSGDRIVVSLRNDGRGAGVAVLAVRSLRFVREAAVHGDQVRLYVDDGTGALPELVRVLEKEGCRVSAVSLSEPTLDDVFLAKTGRSLRDVEPTGAEAA